ncbi:uncharacterized protein N0V89_011503 [Didymosphaeria variabile]|uniref:Uncharacterized protein n=1 Tax=Didymosphaeria variabile TaxID=1932322 RepID=A0A9W8XBE8_9PLEO|nr:uncharacterized protein N0V89_011503 [Didymosphaeria variabile]KAJ4345373.1 hypothetical protein N0V89_011503 [Didymosphaeria variabile]
MTDHQREPLMSFEDMLERCRSLLVDIFHDLPPILNMLEPWYLDRTRLFFIDELRDLLRGSPENMDTHDFIDAVERYKHASEAYDTIVDREESLDHLFQILKRMRDMVFGKVELAAEDEETLDWKEVTDAFESVYTMVRELKDDMRQHLFDHVYYFQQAHEEVDFGYEIKFPRYYAPPPEVTTVSITKVSAHDGKVVRVQTTVGS